MADRYTLGAPSEFEAGKRDLYVFDIIYCPRLEGHAVIASGSNNVINVYDVDTLQLVHQLTGYKTSEGRISSLAYSGRQLWSSSTDGSIRSWDLRSNSEKSLTILQGRNREPFNCLAVGSDTWLVVGGADKVQDDASIYIWDTRAGRAPLAQFTDSHSDDVTEVVFSPSNPKHLASGSVDGLVCLFDLATTDEEEAVMGVKNTGSSVARAGFYGQSSEYVFCLTHTESFHTWSTEEPNPISSHTRIRETMKENFDLSTDYLISCHYESSTDSLYLVVGDHSGGLYVLVAGRSEVRPQATLSGGHSATIRAFCWQSPQLFTGGEDGLLCSWQTC